VAHGNSKTNVYITYISVSNFLHFDVKYQPALMRISHSSDNILTQDTLDLNGFEDGVLS
jgi:hypothetical protein